MFEWFESPGRLSMQQLTSANALLMEYNAHGIICRRGTTSTQCCLKGSGCGLSVCWRRSQHLERVLSPCEEIRWLPTHPKPPEVRRVLLRLRNSAEFHYAMWAFKFV